MPAPNPHPYRQTVIRYVDADGRRCTKSTPGARAVREQTDCYYADLREPGKKRATRFPLETTELGEAWVKLRELQRRLELRRQGITDQYTESAEQPLTSHLEDWLRVVEARGTAPKQRLLLRRSVTQLAQLAHWVRITDLTESSCLEALRALMNLRDARYPEGRSAQTRNHYLAHVQQFVRWLVRDRRLRDNPLLGIGPISVETDRRHDRRAPADEEVALLLEHLLGPQAPERMGMSGRQRALGYEICMATGFRAGELRSLTRASFQLDHPDAAPVVSVRAGYSKRRRRDTQTLPAWLAAELRDWFAGGGGCWEGFPEEWPGRLLQDDLAAARAAWIAAAGDDAAEKQRREASTLLCYEVEVDGMPLFWDFHSWRHWYVTWAANQPGISPKTLMEVCRHSTPTLTLRTYAKAHREQIHNLASQLPNLRPTTPRDQQ